MGMGLDTRLRRYSTSDWTDSSIAWESARVKERLIKKQGVLKSEFRIKTSPLLCHAEERSAATKHLLIGVETLRSLGNALSG